jgi:hypothetical protein
MVEVVVGIIFLIVAIVVDKLCEPIVIERDGDTYIYGHDIHRPLIVRKNGRMEYGYRDKRTVG